MTVSNRCSSLRHFDETTTDGDDDDRSTIKQRTGNLSEEIGKDRSDDYDDTSTSDVELATL